MPSPSRQRGLLYCITLSQTNLHWLVKTVEVSCKNLWKSSSFIVYSLERKGATRTFAERNTAYPKDKRSDIVCRVIYCTVFSLSGRNLISVRNKLLLLSVLSKTVPMWYMLRHRSLSRCQEMRWRLLHPLWKEPKASLKRAPRPRAG